MLQYSRPQYFRQVRNKIFRFDPSTPEEWIIVVDLTQKVLVVHNVTSGPPMYKCMERVLKGDAKPEQTNLVGSRPVGKFTSVMATMTVHIFPASQTNSIWQFIFDLAFITFYFVFVI